LGWRVWRPRPCTPQPRDVPSGADAARRAGVQASNQFARAGGGHTSPAADTAAKGPLPSASLSDRPPQGQEPAPQVRLENAAKIADRATAQPGQIVGRSGQRLLEKLLAGILYRWGRGRVSERPKLVVLAQRILSRSVRPSSCSGAARFSCPGRGRTWRPMREQGGRDSRFSPLPGPLPASWNGAEHRSTR
jgi:hypothetical protein